MSVEKSTYQQQSDLASYCRTGKLADNLAVNKERVHHYRRLVYNVVDDSLQSAFPLTVELLEEEEWDLLVDQFFSTHKNQSTQVWRMPQEFYQFYKETSNPVTEKYRFLNDLLYFEWKEIDLFMMEDRPYPRIQKVGDPLINKWAVNPESEMIKVEFPVHLKNASSIKPEDKGEYFILIFRDKDSGKVQFVDLSTFFALLIENISKGIPVMDFLEAASEQLKLGSIETMLTHTHPFINRLREKEFLIGYLKE